MPPNTNKSPRIAQLSIRFLLSKPNNEFSSLQCKIGYNGEYAGEFVVERKIEVRLWRKDTQRMFEDSVEAELINQKLDLIRADIRRAEIECRMSRNPVTAKSIKAAFKRLFSAFDEKSKNAKSAKKLSFTDLFRAFYERKTKNKVRPISDRTKESYFRYRNNFIKYQEAKKTVFKPDEMTHQWAEEYLNWLISNNYDRGYANNNVQFVKAVLQSAEDQKLIGINSLKGFRFTEDNEYDTTHLTQDEVTKIASFDFSALPISAATAQALREEADCFVVTCYTAQHHADLKSRAVEIYENPIDGRQWLKGRRNKTNVEYNLPIHPTALAILNKYGGVEKLPIKSNVTRNILLKQIAVYCGISKHLTTKIGRKTFASFALNDMKMREETVARILGHSSTKFVKHYANITEHSISEEYRF